MWVNSLNILKFVEIVTWAGSQVGIELLTNKTLILL
jgi:hypothetical protein